MSTTMFHYSLDMLRLYRLSIFYPTLGPTIGIKHVYLRLITKNNAFLIMNGLICIPASKEHVFLSTMASYVAHVERNLPITKYVSQLHQTHFHLIRFDSLMQFSNPLS